MTDPWRLRCPQGHAAIEVYQSRHYCESCGNWYDGTPHDAKHVEFPVDDEPLVDDDRDSVLEALVDQCRGGGRDWVRARDLGARPRQIGQLLSRLEDDGVVDRRHAGNGDLWRPTDAARRRALGDSAETPEEVSA